MPPSSSRTGSVPRGVFVAAIFANAFLLFLLQPLFGRMALPFLGGSSSVWTTCMLFFQAALLGGYLYAHAVASWVPPRAQVVVHVGLLAVAALVLPVAIPAGWTPGDHANPVPSLLGLLLLALGAPFTLLAAGSPLIQHWYARSPASQGRDAYALYAASNLGSAVALLAYPVLVEPRLALRSQAVGWTVGYALLGALLLVCGLAARRASAGASKVEERPERVTWATRGWWTLLAAVPSSLLLGVTTHLTTDLAPVPLLWVVPLALYLLTFIVAFGELPRFPTGALLFVQPYLVLGLAVVLFIRSEVPGWGGYALHLGAFFVCALGCHVALARRRPGASRLTEFYFWLALGGAAGGAFNVLLAPRLFTSVAEYPLALVAAVALSPGKERGARVMDLALPAALAVMIVAVAALLGPDAASETVTMSLVAGGAAVIAFGFREHRLRFALAVLAILGAGRFIEARAGSGQLRLAARSFYGVYRVVDDSATGRRALYSGTTVHGAEMLTDSGREPLTYYHREGPLGDVVRLVQGRTTGTRIAVVGLGAGATAAYARPGESWTFFEIDPLVSRIAADPSLFHFLSEARATPQVVIGDARLSLARDAEAAYDLIVVDAFSSDAIPAHLVTREALALYRARLSPGGIVAWHISNRYVDLRPVLEGLAADAGMVAVIRDDTDLPAENRGRYSSTWVAMASSDADLAPLRSLPGWQPLRSGREPIVWRDDFSNILELLR